MENENHHGKNITCIQHQGYQLCLTNKEYGKCLSSLWHIFVKFLDNDSAISNIFRYVIFFQVAFFILYKLFDF